MKRTPLKRGNSKLRSTYKSMDTKKQEEHSKQVSQKKAEMFAFLVQFFIELPNGSRVCNSCGKQLSNEIRSYYFDHLIEKSKRPDLALEKDNIFLCCLECHALKTDGHPTEIHQKAIEKARERFGIS